MAHLFGIERNLRLLCGRVALSMKSKSVVEDTEVTPASTAMHEPVVALCLPPANLLNRFAVNHTKLARKLRILRSHCESRARAALVLAREPEIRNGPNAH